MVCHQNHRSQQHFHKRICLFCLAVYSVCHFHLPYLCCHASSIALSDSGQIPDFLVDRESSGSRERSKRDEFSKPGSFIKERDEENVTARTSSESLSSSLTAFLSTSTPEQEQPPSAESHEPTHKILRKLFDRYGRDGVMTFDGFERLLQNIGLSEVEDLDIGGRSDDGTGRQTERKKPDIQDTGVEKQMSDELVLRNNRTVDGLEEKTAEINYSNPSAYSTDENSVSDDKCLNSQEILEFSGLDVRDHLSTSDFVKICPTLIYVLDKRVCHNHDNHDNHHGHHILRYRHRHGDSEPGVNGTKSSSVWRAPSAAVWGYSFAACLAISAIGLVAVAIIPIMHRVIYNHLLHFLVALAIGSLSGDALLHLLPHAVNPHIHDDHDNIDDHHDRYSIHLNDTIDDDAAADDDDDHQQNKLSKNHAIWCGLTALGGILLFFIVERIVGYCSERNRRARLDSEKNDFDASNLSFGSKSGKDDKHAHKNKTNHSHTTSCEETVMMVHANKEVRQLANNAHDEVHKDCEGMQATRDDTNNWGHHAHVTGGHHHSHEVPKSVAAVAWVVIVGDGFHNFADGIAIGSAFASGITGGLSTSIAVICHELPHELGDFAMLLKAGMSAKKALVYNCVSSILCLVGMIFGVALGNFSSVNPWIFATIAGIFLYIALVDMLPEMKSVDPRKGEHPLLHFLLQVLGIIIGSGIMLLIALYEDRIHLE